MPAEFDARYSTPRAEQRLIGEPVRIGLGIDGARTIAPNDPWRSAVLTRLLTTEPTKMPPLAHSVVDRRGAELIRAWIASLPGPRVLAPPTIRPGSGDFHEPVRVAIEHPDPDATIRYTLDGSAPGKTSPIYQGAFEVRASTTIRAGLSAGMDAEHRCAGDADLRRVTIIGPSARSRSPTARRRP